MSVRRTWDKELYAQKAAARAELKSMEEQEEEYAQDIAKIKKRKLESASGIKEEFQAAESDALGPLGSQRAYLKSRTSNLSEQLHADVGKTQVVTKQAMELGVGGGFWCETCACLLKDSSAYLSHINGKKHQRTLGFSMRVEQKGLDAVKERLEAVKAELLPKQELSFKSSTLSGMGLTISSSAPDAAKYQEQVSIQDYARLVPKSNALEELDQQIAEREQSHEAIKQARKAEKAAKRQRAAQEEEEEQGVDPEIAALMGFGAFGRGGKH